jgi:4-alpha-glucanotransferase
MNVKVFVSDKDVYDALVKSINVDLNRGGAHLAVSSIFEATLMKKTYTAIIPMQDVLGVGEHARMNRPATLKGNWRWRLQSDDLRISVAKKLAKITDIYSRT